MFFPPKKKCQCVRCHQESIERPCGFNCVTTDSTTMCIQIHEDTTTCILDLRIQKNIYLYKYIYIHMCDCIICVRLTYITIHCTTYLWFDYITYIHIHVAITSHVTLHSIALPRNSWVWGGLGFRTLQIFHQRFLAPLGLAWNQQKNPGQALSFKANTNTNPHNCQPMPRGFAGLKYWMRVYPKSLQKESWLANIWARGERNLIEHRLDWGIWISEYLSLLISPGVLVKIEPVNSHSLHYSHES